MDALNDDMDGILDASKIKNISNETIRAFYQNLSDSYLTIVRYEETPVVEIDWTKIDALDATFSEGLEYVINARSYNTNIDYLDYYDIAERVVALEKMIALETSAFVKSQMLDLYEMWTSYLVVGPEGTHIELYVNKEDSLYEEMFEFSYNYEATNFGQFMRTLVEGDYEDYSAAYDQYDNFMRTNVFKTHQWTTDESIDGDNSSKTLIYENKVDVDLTKSVNRLISLAVEEVIDAIELTVPYKVEVFQYEASEETATLLVTASYDISATERGFVEKYITIDLETGREMYLNEYLQVSSTEVLELINKLGDADFTILPAYGKSYNGIYLKANNEDISKKRFVEIAYKDLIPYVKQIPYPIIEEKKTAAELFQEDLQAKLESSMSTREYVEFMEESIDQLSSEETEKMIETLRIFQTDTIIQGDELLNQEDYRTAYFTEEYNDETIEAFFEMLDDTYLHVVSDEELLSLELDWEKIADLEATYSEAFAYVVETRSDVDKLYGDSYYDMAKNMVKLEVLEDRVSSKFVKAELESLYDLWASQLLIGSAGEHNDAFVMKTGQLYDALIRFSEAYSGSDLGRFINNMESIESLSQEYASGSINAFILSENIGQKKWSIKELVDGDSRIYQLVYQEIGNSEVSEKVNTTISISVNDLIQSMFSNEAMLGQAYTIESMHFYRSMDYVTLYMSIDYGQSDLASGIDSRIISIDLNTGEKIGFDGYLGVEEHQAISILNELMGLALSSLPDFQVTSSGVFLKYEHPDTGEKLYESISKRQLIPYLNK